MHKLEFNLIPLPLCSCFEDSFQQLLGTEAWRRLPPAGYADDGQPPQVQLAGALAIHGVVQVLNRRINRVVVIEVQIADASVELLFFSESLFPILYYIFSKMIFPCKPNNLGFRT